MEKIELASGASVPKACVDALDNFDAEIWPGATFPTARAAIVNVVLNAYLKEAENGANEMPSES
jgi:hypothetical protein